MPLKLCLTGNEPRQKYLFEELARTTQVQAVIPFDQIDPVTKFSAAALSFSWPRSEWWENYHMHPLLQRRRQRVLARGMESLPSTPDALLMWGSWFEPLRGPGAPVPYFHYIDQSHSLQNLPGEPPGRFARRKRAHALQGECYAHSGGIFCMSEWAREQTLDAHRVAEDKIVAVGWGPCGVNFSDLALASTPREPIVLHVSNDFHRKGVDYLLATAEVVWRAVPEARFLVVGRDSSGFSVPANSRVEFTGPIYDKPKLSNLFATSSVFFLPHRFDRSPHVLVEAMSAALPLVASAQGGAIELIRGKDTGFMCQPGNVNEYAEAIVTLLRDRDLQARMGANGLALMKARYNWSAIARTMLTFIERARGGVKAA